MYQASGLIYWMFRIWRTKLFTETLIAVAVNGSDDALRQLLLITTNILLPVQAVSPARIKTQTIPDLEDFVLSVVAQGVDPYG